MNNARSVFSRWMKIGRSRIEVTDATFFRYLMHSCIDGPFKKDNFVFYF